MPPPRHCPACTTTASTDRCTRAAVPPAHAHLAAYPYHAHPRAGRARWAGSHPSPRPRAARHSTHGHSRSEVHTPPAPPHRTGQAWAGTAPTVRHTHTHTRTPDVPTSPSAGKTGRVGSAKPQRQTRQMSECAASCRFRQPSGAATQHRVPPTRAIPCPPRCTTTTSTMATTTGACHLDNPPPGRAPATDDQRRAVNNQRPAAKPDTINGQWSDRVGYHHSDTSEPNRSLGPSQSRPLSSAVFYPDRSLTCRN